MSLSLGEDGVPVVRAPLGFSLTAAGRFVRENAAWIEKQTAARAERLERYPPLSAEESGRLRETAAAYLPGRTEYFAKIMELRPASVKITSAERRFGSCSAKNGICFSYRIMRYPPMFIDYVIVHELAHIRHKNHGREFYGLVESVLPDYRVRRKLFECPLPPCRHTEEE